ncbi:MAG: 50S ribosomal protein L3, partial [Deltaproteobacteria bacterium]|nr:50S ribosomal protein L3 [Deltaproteobacteria bacterium]
IDLNIFEIGEKVNVTGTTKGRGFAGVMKRHGFSGGSASHGNTTHRGAGSIGAAAYPARVFPGKKMAGHYGSVRQTVRNLEVIDVRPEYGVLLLKGHVPGPKNGIVLIKKQ